MPTLRQLHILRSPTAKVRIISRLSSQWQAIGDILEFDGSGAKLMDIELDNNKDPKSCCRDVFRLWLTGEGVRPCSWQKLIEILGDIDQEMLAKEIEAVLPYDIESQTEVMKD